MLACEDEILPFNTLMRILWLVWSVMDRQITEECDEGITFKDVLCGYESHS